MNVAIVHYWLVGMRGGEKVVEALLDLYPNADIYSHVVDSEKISKKLNDRVVGTTFIDKLPGAKKRYQSYLPLMPYALEELDLTGYDLVISSESGPAKGIITAPHTVHICYCHSPMRYVWDMYHEYTKGAGFFKKSIMAYLLHRMRLWDLASSFRVDHFVANSSFINRRIEKYYRRESHIVFPPIDVSAFEVSETMGDFYLIVGQLVGYKNVSLAIDAFNKNGKKLIIIGTGEEFLRLKSDAESNINMMGYQPFAVVKKHLSECKALVFPGVEDFGMVPVEAMASGRPVIALNRGGAVDSVINDVTGVLFDQASVESLNAAINYFEENIGRFKPEIIRKHAFSFDVSFFTSRMKAFVDDKVGALCDS